MMITIADKIRGILTENKSSRTDDCILYARYITKHHSDLKHVELVDAFKNHKKYGLPSFKTISRTRQSIQVKYPELKG
jgi:hypothetical protein